MKAYGSSLIGLGKQLAFLARYVRRYGRLLMSFPLFIAIDMLFDIGIAKLQGYFIDIADSGTVSKLCMAIEWVSFTVVSAILLLVTYRYLIRILSGWIKRDLSAAAFRSVEISSPMSNFAVTIAGI